MISSMSPTHIHDCKGKYLSEMPVDQLCGIRLGNELVY